MEDPHLTVERFLCDEPTDEEKAAFVETALVLLTQKSLANSTASGSLGDVLSAVTAVRAVFDTINSKFNSATYVVWAMLSPNILQVQGRMGSVWSAMGPRIENVLLSRREERRRS